jgi:uncharacterized protein (TIGR03086 family)
MRDAFALLFRGMSENLRRYTTIVFGFEHVLRLGAPDAWGNPSPCEGWNARQVAGHAMAVVNNVAARAGVGDVVDPFENLEATAGDEPMGSFRAIRDRYLLATDQQGALQRVVNSRLGEMTLDEYIGKMCLDTLVHTWDLARALDVDDALDPGAVQAVYATCLAGLQTVPREPGRYDHAIPADTLTSEQERLIAFTGRDPRRRPARA